MPLASIQKHLLEYERPKRKAISSRFPFLVTPAIFIKRTQRNIQNRFKLTKLKKGAPLLFVIARHSSPLYRQLQGVDNRLQQNKVTNLRIAVAKLDGLIIPPGEIFSLWHAVGKVDRKLGYADGMLLSNGAVSEGVGGGLCQLSNFLFWIFLHADMEVTERHYHSVDAFPDSGRTLPFGSGATIFSNYLDLQAKNLSKGSMQLRLWLTEDALKGQLLSDVPSSKKFHVAERNHCFVKKGDSYFRYNEIYRETFENGVKTGEQEIAVNFAPVVYPVTEEYLSERGYRLVKL